jgi:nicotinamidase-related amidase
MKHNAQIPFGAEPFLQWLEEWLAGLPPIQMEQAAPQPERTAIISVDVINGFCYEGPLSSPRVAGIVEPIARLFERAWESGVRSIVLTQDTHEPEAVEFAQWPSHCVRGTHEAETVDAFRGLSFFSQMTVLEKNSIHSGLNTGLNEWLEANPQIDTFLVVGDCTDLCTYQLAMHLRLDANARQIQRRVIIPADCVQTYDMPVDTARTLGILPHPGDVIHAMFLYHMALNGVEVTASIA